ncbi:putative gustatory receptor 28a isoform X1 [Microplitis mediator]|uniref:putative gustatory receptor 28a isoform X1 n=1 Tax=Microplitis mediator TaxID=375433 RepID=UPI002553C387|nr:putative gustatory receptor 28a isoform X1 [Microplitis mediator]
MYYNKYDSAVHRNFVFIQSIFFKVIGLSPWTLGIFEIFRKQSKANNYQNYKCKFSYLGSIYNIFLIILMVSLILNVIFNESFHQLENDSFLTDSIEAKIHYVSTFATCGVFSTYIIQQKFMINAINRLKSVDEKLIKCAAYKTKSDKIIIVIFIIHFLLFTCEEIVEIYYYPLQSALMRDLPAVINCWILMQYTIIMDVINKRFEMINSAFSKFKRNKGNASTSQSSSLSNLSILHELFYYDIDNLKYAHAELCEICQDIGEFFGLPMLVTILHTIETMIATLFFFIVLSVNVQESDPGTYLSDVIWLMWIIHGFIVLTSYATRIEKESKKIAGVVDAIMDQCTMDKKMQRKLFIFSHALSHRSVELNVCDIMPLNRTLLQTVAGTIVTYLIILIQFRNCSSSNQIN